MSVVPLSTLDLLIASSLVAAAGLVSLALRLRMEGSLALAATRTVLQLLLLGLLLEWIFAIEAPWALFPFLLIMVVAGSRAAVARSKRRYGGIYLRTFSTLLVSAVVVTFTVTNLVVAVEPWWKPQYVLPLFGMVLGNSLTGISLGLDALLESFQTGRPRIELELSLGATRWEAAREPLREAVRKGLVPIINAMSVAGIVSIPGMMTGQILAGQSPLAAVKYQIVVMFMISAATALGTVLIALLTYRRLFNERHQLQAQDITGG